MCTALVMRGRWVGCSRRGALGAVGNSIRLLQQLESGGLRAHRRVVHRPQPRAARRAEQAAAAAALQPIEQLDAARPRLQVSRLKLHSSNYEPHMLRTGPGCGISVASSEGVRHVSVLPVAILVGAKL